MSEKTVNFAEWKENAEKGYEAAVKKIGENLQMAAENGVFERIAEKQLEARPGHPILFDGSPIKGASCLEIIGVNGLNANEHRKEGFTSRTMIPYHIFRNNEIVRSTKKTENFPVASRVLSTINPPAESGVEQFVSNEPMFPLQGLYTSDKSNIFNHITPKDKAGKAKQFVKSNPTADSILQFVDFKALSDNVKAAKSPEEAFKAAEESYAQAVEKHKVWAEEQKPEFDRRSAVIEDAVKPGKDATPADKLAYEIKNAMSKKPDAQLKGHIHTAAKNLVKEGMSIEDITKAINEVAPQAAYNRPGVDYGTVIVEGNNEIRKASKKAKAAPQR